VFVGGAVRWLADSWNRKPAAQPSEAEAEMTPGVLLSTGYVGLATVLAGVALPLWALLEGRDGAWLGFAVAVAVLLAWTHRANLQRLRAGNEHRFEKARLLARLWARPDA
jgi:hypothetical protein